MSITGKGSLSLRKQDVVEQKNLATGYKKLTFAHKATLGATGINLASLTTPTEMSSVGFVNPSGAELLAAQLFFYRKNFTLISSLRGCLMDYLSYDVPSSTQINFNGFTAEDGEIFIGVIDYNARNGVNLVDAAPLVATGTITVGQTDFNVGQLFEVNKYSSGQVGAVVVYRNGVQQFRNTSNSSVSLDGNYYEVNNGSGSGQVIRFNVAATGTDSILVVSNGMMAYNPDASALQRIEALSGKIDAMVPTLADLAGVPQTNFQAAPSSVDLKSFGDNVLTQGVRITNLEKLPIIQTKTATGAGTYVPSAGARFAKVTVIGGGASGGGGTTNNVTGAGGAAGGTAIKWFSLSGVGTIPLTVGAGGAAVAGGNGAGNAGGASSFGPIGGVTLTANGGNAPVDVHGSQGGTASGGDINITGGGGGPGANGATTLWSPAGNGGSSFMGGGGYGATQNSGTSTGGAGGSYGAGGGGGSSNSTAQGGSGAGANGVIIIEEYF